VTLPARFPGISGIWQHVVSFDRQRFPEIPGVSNRPPAEEAFHRVPEAIFPTMDDLALFQAHAKVQMEDGINFLADMLGHASLGPNSPTVVDKLDNPAPDGSDDLVRHLVFLRGRDGISVGDFRRFVSEQLVPSWASSPDPVLIAPPKSSSWSPWPARSPTRSSSCRSSARHSCSPQPCPDRSGPSPRTSR
jgi:hypothetical protein